MKKIVSILLSVITLISALISMPTLAFAECNHNWAEKEEHIGASCEQNEAIVKVCTICKTQTYVYIEGTALTHDYSYSSTFDGYHVKRCKNCGDVALYEKCVSDGRIGIYDRVNPTCIYDGYIEKVSHCVYCGEEIFEKGEILLATKHNLKSFVLSTATTNSFGELITVCQNEKCGFSKRKIVQKIETIKLSDKKYTYDGNVKNSTIIIKDSAGNILKNGEDYTVSIPKGRKLVGKYTYKITFKGKYSGTKYLSFNIVPKNTSITKLTATKGGFKATIKKYTAQTTGYQIRYSTSSKMTNAKTATVAKNTTTSKSVTKLAKGKKYYVQIRTFKTVGKTKYYSSWSKAKTVTTTK